jgi:hypothetical protein
MKKPAANSTSAIGGVSSPQSHLWLIKDWFSASSFVVKIATFAKPQNVTFCKPTFKLASTKKSPFKKL